MKNLSPDIERLRGQINHFFQEQDHAALEKMLTEGRALRFTITPERRLEVVMNVEWQPHSATTYKPFEPLISK